MNSRVERLRKAPLAWGLAAAILIGSLFVLATPVAALVTPGATTPLVNVGQLVRDGSTAVPIFGITAASTLPTDQLLSISVAFTGTGFNPGNAGDLRALNTNPALSGVALYRDVGTVPGRLDASDVGVTATAVAWNVTRAVLTFAEPFPTIAAGAFDWILVIRTSNNAASLANSDQIVATIPAGGIVFSGAVTQPAASVSAATLTVSLTSATNLIAPQAWIGPLADAVNARAVLGIRIVDGGIPTNVGIDDMLSQVIVHIFDNSLTYAATSLRAPNVNPALSGIGLYRDTNGNGLWDPADAPVMLSAISLNCVAPLDVEDWCLSPNAEPVPNVAPAGYSYFVVVRSNAMASGDDFQFDVEANQIFASGVHANDANRPTLLTPATSSSLLGDDTPPCVTTACGQPFGIHWANPTASPYLFPVDRVLFFGHGMTAAVPGQVVLSASDGESGLAQAVFTNEPSLAGSPAPVALTGSGVGVTVRANYSFSMTSTAASSPASVTVFDAVGNAATAPALVYVLDAVNPLVVPAPGWRNLPGPNFYVNATGTLWFSPWIPGTQTVDIRVNLADTSSGLKNATATSEPSLAGGPIYRSPTDLGAVGTFNGWTVSYSFNAASTDASSPATITSCDQVANCASANFVYSLDAVVPSVSILGPTAGRVLSGRVVVAATATDAGSGVAGPLQVMVLGQSGFMNMVWNGTAWVWPISTALYPDGANRIVVRAFDNVANEGVATAEVIFNNADVTPPVVAFVAPGANAVASGILDVRVSATDAGGLASVSLTFGTTTVAMASVGSSVFAYPLDTTGLTTGTVTLSVTVTDLAGLATTRTVSIRVDNSAPTIALGSPSSDRGAIVLRATVSDSPSGVATVMFVVDGKTFTAIADGQGGYSVTIWTTTADNGGHSYEVIATDRAGNTATSSGAFAVNNPTDYFAAVLAFSPLGIFALLLAALIVGLLIRRRGKGSEPVEAKPEPPPPEPKKPVDDL
jgi:hypothetical protein